ncbi:MAG: hypothetical protein IJS87_05045 [Rhodocyclaceae bacterium]|nr:hypothetical protein [Rhodocyclaceae bacterium]
MGDMATDLCWGKRVLDKVVKWDAPMSMGDYKMTNIAYTYKIANLAEWGRTTPRCRKPSRVSRRFLTKTRKLR